MTIDPEKLAEARRCWAQVDLDEPLQNPRRDKAIHNIQKMLAEMGLDLTCDATYELLEEGLTKAEFDRHFEVAATRAVLNQYFHALAINDHDDPGRASARRVYALERLCDHYLPRLDKILNGKNQPSGLTALEAQQMEFIRAAYRDGMIATAIQQAAGRAAQDYFRVAWRYEEDVRRKAKFGENPGPLPEGLRAAEKALAMMNKAGAFFQAAEIFVEYDMDGPDRNGARALCSREAAQEKQQFFLLRSLAVKFNTALAYQDKGHFILDVTGGAYGAHEMPMQEIARTLADYGYDIHKPATFTAIGTDYDRFWAAYKCERAAVAAQGQYNNLIGPSLAP